jgi:pseudouridine kinase
LTGAAAVVVDCNLSEEALQWLFASGVSAPLFFDGVSVTKCQRLKRYLSRINMLKVNLLEAQALTGIEITSPQDAMVAAKNLAELGVGCGVVSLGRQGIAWWDAAGNVGLREGRKMEVVSTSGAGDALLSGLIHGFMAAAPFTDALNFGLRCAEFTLSSPHANHPGLSLHSLTNGAIP